jgi:dihydrolipoamide dehydrogenase
MLFVSLQKCSVLTRCKSRPGLYQRLSKNYQARPTFFMRWYTTATEQDDVVIIGGGPGGYVAAIKAAQLGLKVTCVEKRGALGGTCLNVGCIPSKALLNISHHYEMAKHWFPKHGIIVQEPKIDIPTMMKAKNEAVRGLTSGIEFLFNKYGAKYEKGYGRIISPNEVQVTLTAGGTKILKTKNIVIATGSEPIPLPGVEIDEKRVVTSTGALELSSVPNHLVLIGGGIIGLEMGSVWNRLGSKVTVVEFTDMIAAGADGEISKLFKRVLETQGLKFLMKSKVTAVEKKPNILTVTIEDLVKNTTSKIDADVVLVAVGRRPYTEGLGLKEVGVKVDSKGRVETDEHFRTNIPNIYAIGDVIKGPMLAHKAEEEGIAVIENIASSHGPIGHVNYLAIPSVVYTHPEVAWVGYTEEQLKEKNLPYKVGKFPFRANSRARTNDDTEGLVKFLADPETDRLLGVHMIGPNVGELIAEAVLAIEYGASSEDIARTCHAHPTLSEAVKEAALATFNKSIHA